jgi:hypothetical protein
MENKNKHHERLTSGLSHINHQECNHDAIDIPEVDRPLHGAAELAPFDMFSDSPSPFLAAMLGFDLLGSHCQRHSSSLG